MIFFLKYSTYENTHYEQHVSTLQHKFKSKKKLTNTEHIGRFHRIVES